MKIEIPVKVYFDDVQGMIDEIKILQTYKLFEGDDMVLVDLDAVVAIMANHIRATDKCSEFPNGWIPCSERLPEEYGEFLVTMTEKAKAEDLGFDLDETYIRKMRYNSNGWQLPRRIPSWINEAVKDEVLAWMPLPEPYKEEGEQDGN